VLLRPAGEAVIAIGQASHAWLAGQLARAWGNERFPAPQPYEEVVLGATQHDIGMAEWDLAPALHPDTGLPVRFYELDRPTHLALWTQAPQRVLSQSRYAALLVSLHGTGLYERFPPPPGDPEVARLVASYLEGQRALQERLAAEVGASKEELRRNQALLAAWDDLSLALCQAQAPHEVHGVPGAAGPESLALRAAGDGAEAGTLTLDPWPFAHDTVRVRAEGRRLDGAPYPDAPALHAALDRAPVESVEVLLVRTAPLRAGVDLA
jgi:hypothetical protein